MYPNKHSDKPSPHTAPGSLTTLLGVAIVANQNLLAGRPEERRPVDGVVVAQAAVVEDVNIAGGNFGQRLELE